jgi:hypothetical protein
MLLGELLVAQKLATAGDVNNALARQERYGGRVGDHLIDMGVITKEILESALRSQYQLVMAILAREDLLKRSIARFGSDHPQTYRQCSLLASVLIAAGRLTEALELARRASAGQERLLGAEHPWTEEAAQVMADIETAIEALEGLKSPSEDPDDDVLSAENPAGLPGEGPAVAPGIGAGEEDCSPEAVVSATDDLDAARPFEVADSVDGVSAPGELPADVVIEAPLHGQNVGPDMGVVSVLTRYHRRPTRHLGRLLRA